jgi:hypothetical protein
MHVRHITTGDLAGVAALLQSSRTRAYTNWPGTDSTLATLADDMTRPHSESFVALAQDGAIIGYAYARMRRAALWLDRMIVSDQCGDEDAAALLHAVVINYIGEPAISVATDAGDDRARRFHEDQGFVRAAETDADGATILRRLIARA